MTQERPYKLPFHFELDNVDFLGVLEDFDEGVIIADPSGRIVYYNEAMGKIDDLNPDYAVGQRIVEVYDLNEDTSIIMECLKNGCPIVNRHLFYRTRIGKFANTIHRVYPLYRSGEMIGAICFVRDYHVLENTIASVAIPMRQSDPEVGTIYSFDDIVGINQLFQRAVNTALMAANSPSPIMLYGETGTGKELFAQSIHSHSLRRKRRYIPVNCAAIPENLLEGILFGTSKGAFTGALDKPGLFERANGGTIFLDEVNSMPIGLQAKILRVIQEKKVRRLGSLNEIEVDLKIVSSVSREPHRDIEDHILRPDLFYRLGVVFIRIPPLRERRDDLGLLVEHFLQKVGKSHGIRVRGLGHRVINSFYEYDWPGNVRELEHVIEGAINVVGNEETIRFKHLPHHFAGKFEIAGSRDGQSRSDTPTGSGRSATVPFREAASLSPGMRPPETGGRRPGGASNLVEAQAQMEKELVCRALTESLGNVKNAALKLGISRQLLHYKLKKFGLDRKEFKPPPAP
jgi:arginine utilization regulatory protein